MAASASLSDLLAYALSVPALQASELESAAPADGAATTSAD